VFSFLIPSKLVDLLKRDRVPVASVVALLSINICFQSLSGSPGFFGFRSYPGLLPFLVLHLGIGLASLWICYFANGGAEGRDFLGRFAALSTILYFWVWIVGYIALVLFSWTIYFLVGAFTFEYFKPFGIAQLVFAAIGSLIYLLWIQYLFGGLKDV